MNKFRFCALLLIPTALACMPAAWAAPAPVPLAPKGRITNTFVPAFRWTDTGAALYTFHIIRDIGSVQTDTVPTNRYTPAFPLDVGAYTWQVKKGGVNSTAPWSVPLAFTIPPETPTPSSPRGWLGFDSFQPDFKWASTADSDVNRFTLELFSGSNSLGFLQVDGFAKDSVAATWPDTLPKGVYAWRVKAIRLPGGYKVKLTSDWSPLTAFSIGVPAAPVITNPAPNTVYSPGLQTIPFRWTPCEGANYYNMLNLRNGSFWQSVSGVAAPVIKYFANFTPGYYTFTAAASNNFGVSPFSKPLTILVKRIMVPGNDAYTNGFDAFTWTRSEIANYYRIKIFRFNAQQGIYEIVRQAKVFQTAVEPVYSADSELSKPGAYKWQVTDFFMDKPLYTSTDYFSIQVPTRPPILGPIGLIYGLSDVSFRWQSAAGSPTHYQLQVWKNGVLLRDSGWAVPGHFLKIPGSYFTRYSFNTVGAGKYMWRVRAKNATGKGAWRQTQCRLAPLGSPTILAPTNQAHFATGSNITIQWTAVENATYYMLEFRTNGVAFAASGFSAHPSPIQQGNWAVAPGKVEIRARAGFGQISWGPWKSIGVIGE
jgi:hypothetical protein